MKQKPQNSPSPDSWDLQSVVYLFCAVNIIGDVKNFGQI